MLAKLVIAGWADCGNKLIFFHSYVLVCGAMAHFLREGQCRDLVPAGGLSVCTDICAHPCRVPAWTLTAVHVRRLGHTVADRNRPVSRAGQSVPGLNIGCVDGQASQYHTHCQRTDEFSGSATLRLRCRSVGGGLVNRCHF